MFRQKLRRLAGRLIRKFLAVLGTMPLLNSLLKLLLITWSKFLFVLSEMPFLGNSLHRDFLRRSQRALTQSSGVPIQKFINLIQRKLGLTVAAPAAMSSAPEYIETYRNFNLVKYRSKCYAFSNDLGVQHIASTSVAKINEWIDAGMCSIAPSIDSLKINVDNIFIRRDGDELLLPPLCYDTEPEIEPLEVIPDWRYVFYGDQHPSDIALIKELWILLAKKNKPVVLVGRSDMAKIIMSISTAVNCHVVTGDHRIELEPEYKESIKSFANTQNIFFICESDRLNAQELRSLLGNVEALDFDVLAKACPDLMPRDAWCEIYDHIYPLAVPMPEIHFEPGLDVLILDVPARSIAQLPVGFAFVYKALKRTSLKFQAMDVDIIAYHRYHVRRCANHWHEVRQGDFHHPQDPWQAASYLYWTNPQTFSYFENIIDELCRKILAAKPKVLGFSLHQTSQVFIKAIVDRVIPHLPNTVLVVGGMSCYHSNIARFIFPAAEYVVVGEADVVVGPLFEALARGERPKNLPGIVSRHDTSDHIYVGAPLSHNLDLLGAPDYGFTNLDLYRNWNNYALMPVVGSRGCGWSRCTFCAERFNWRARTPELVAEEIEYYNKRGFKDFVFNESDFNSNHEFVIRLCKDIIRRGLVVNLSAQLRISRKSDLEYFALMKNAGFGCLRFGVDGFSKNALKLQRKGYLMDDVRNNLRDCAKTGIYTEVNVVIGVPGETEDDVDEAIDFLVELKSEIGRVAFINPLMLFVSSVYYNEPEQFNIKFRQPKEDVYKKYVVSFPDDVWYSEEPYIDHEVRHQRLCRMVERLIEENVPLGDFAKFTIQHRKENKQGTEVFASEKLQAMEDLSEIKEEDTVVATKAAVRATQFWPPVHFKRGHFYRASCER